MRTFLPFVVAMFAAAPIFAQERGVSVRPSAGAAPGERRVALVIGNEAYPSAALRNPVNDARAMAAALREVGFEVVEKENATGIDMQVAIDEFGDKLKQSGIGLFYYSGHGAQINGENYLLPVDVKLNNEKYASYSSVTAQKVLDSMKTAGNRMNILILDACRNNPFPRTTRAAENGLAKMDAARGTLIAYATSPGSKADDSDGGVHSPYTASLLLHLKDPGAQVEQVFKRVTQDVDKQTGSRQTPWYNSSVIGEFAFMGAKAPDASAAATARTASTAPSRTLDDEEVLWKTIENSTNSEDFSDYLNAYPKGRFAVAARIKLRQTQAKAAPSGPSGPALVKLPISTTPGGASVTIDRAYRGKTPLDVEGLAEGEHNVEIVLQGYQPWKKTVVLKARGNFNLNETMLESKGSALDIQGIPTDAEVLIDGMSRGRGPMKLEELPPGRYAVRFRAPTIREWTGSVVLKDGETSQLEPTISPLQLAIFPAKMTGQSINAVDPKFGPRSSSEKALIGFRQGLEPSFRYFGIAYSSYRGYGERNPIEGAVESKAWKGFFAKEPDIDYLRTKAKEWDLDAIALFKYDDPGHTVTAYVYDTRKDQLYEDERQWVSGNLGGGVAASTTAAMRKYLSANGIGN